MAEFFSADLQIGKGESASQIYDGQLINKLAQELQTSTNAHSSKLEIQKLPSGNSAAHGVMLGQTDPNARLEVTIQMKSKASEAEMDRVLKNIAAGKQAPLTEAQFNKEFGSSAKCFEAVNKFAKENGLTISKADLNSGQVILTGATENFAKAFQTTISDYDDGDVVVHGRSGDLKIPRLLSGNIEGVFGLDGSPQSKSHAVEFKQEQSAGEFGSRIDTSADADAAKETPKSYMPNEVADAYNFPAGTTGKGQSVAIIELGGGLDLKNEAEYYKEHGMKMPEIQIVELAGAKNTPGKRIDWDREVALDSQVLGAAAPDAKQMVIFAPNGGGDKGFIDAVTRATFTEAGEAQNSVISISWGKPIDTWNEQSKHAMNLALKKAALKGITVFVAAGDDGANDGSGHTKPTVDYPAADQFATSVGGSSLVLENGKISSEVVWNNKHGATGGGISTDEVPDFQKGLPMPVDPTTGRAGRGEPDITGDADPSTGYKIRLNHSDIVSGGTSATAPLYAALALRLNEALASSKQSVGYMNPFLYKSGMAGAPFFNDITEGNNNGFSAGKGWDAASGWGSVNGELLLQALRQQRLSNTKIA